MKCRKCHKEIEHLKVCPYCKGKQITKDIIKEVDSTSKIVEEQLVKVSILNNPIVISIIMIGLLFLYLMINAYNNEARTLGFIFSNLLSFWLLAYFILLQFKKGKVYFKYLNLLTGLILLITFIKVLLNIFVNINFINIFEVISYLLLSIFFIKSFFKKEVKDIDQINIFNNRLYFYSIIVSFLITFMLIELQYINNIDYIILTSNILRLGVVFFFARYIYLYDTNNTSFIKINKLARNIDNSKIKKYFNSLLDKYNFYQLGAFLIFVGGIILGIVFGSEYAVCNNNTYDMCLEEEFNISYMFITFGIAFFISAILYWMGDVKSILIKIQENSTKKVKKSVKNID